MMKHASTSLFVSLIVMMLMGLLPATIALADSTRTLSPIVVTATMTEQNLDVAPGTVEVVTKEDIDAMGAESVTDVLQQATGIVIVTGTGRTQSVSLRGLGAGHTLVLLDGRRIVSGYKINLDVNQIPVTLIDHIEIVRGPGSALYGSEATGGVINIITRQPPRQFEGEVDLRGGMGESAENSAQGMVGTAIGPLRFNLAAARFKKDDWDNDGELPDDIDDTVQDTAFLHGAMDLGKTQTLSMGGEWNRLTRDGLRLLQNQERRREADDRRWGGFLKYNVHPDGPFSGMFQIYGNRNESDAETTPGTGESTRTRDLLQAEARGTYLLTDGLSLTGGGEWRRESLEGEELVEEATDGESDRVKALFGQIDWHPYDWFNIVGSLRFDDYDNSGSQFSPRVVASLFIPHGRFWLAYGHGFRSPTLDEMYGEVYKYQGRYVYYGNPDLEPETSRGYEAGIELRGPKVWGRAVGFYNQLEDKIEAQLISSSGRYSTFKYHNVEEVWTAGAELEAGINLLDNLTLSGQSTYLDTENEETEEELAYEPNWKGSLTLKWNVPAFRLETQVRYLYVGACEDGEGERLEGYERVNLYVAKALTTNLRLYAGIDNLFDEENDDFTQSPFQVYAGLNITF
ncbi:TonB-dependent receptor plug domain-containing protein [Desulfosarcina ovata]|uniref:TonB-dependent receptor n=2 Tax=Desulfosarcina ovata TaxID=83564 RepID=A0A5K8ANE6_9BACT|nr:TonB-dependent receptor [Desulfosarcina ovata]BBO86466.1 TonB-dependent receptor [Desulfosarcina ovata subsp. sediminis]BBO93390.1 TonB-dependent receptor [Desulfosarcina ovata subsp. ovata]